MIGGPNPSMGNRMAQHSFAQRPDVHMARSQFDRSFAIKDTMNFDELTPIFVDEIIPGDTCNLTLNTFARLATQQKPIMDNMYIDYFFFFVPNRLVWDNWEKMCGAQDNPGDSTDFIFPTITSAGGGFTEGSLYDKFGLPINAGPLTINNLPARASNLIWNEWFRDQNLQNSLSVPKDDGPDTLADFETLRIRGKRHDYFTSCLPFLQKGPAVDLPFGGSAPIVLAGGVGQVGAGEIPRYVSSLTATPANTTYKTNGGGFLSDASTGNPLILDPNGSLIADLTLAGAVTINALRQAFQMQALLELDARGGTRYVEILQAHYNVTSPDFRLQRPEFLGGGSQKISSHPVPNTTGVGSQNQADLAAFGTSSSNGQIGFTKSFVEHGYVIGYACARADLTYQQGVNRMWSKSTRYDLFWPKLQELGEQAVLQKEIYATGTGADDGVFGYQERYAEYRFKPSEIHGQFRSTFVDPIDNWHLAEWFATAPALNGTFIEQSTPIARVVYDTTHPALLWDGWFSYKHARPMVAYSTPVSLGRF